MAKAITYIVVAAMVAANGQYLYSGEKATGDVFGDQKRVDELLAAGAIADSEKFTPPAPTQVQPVSFSPAEWQAERQALQDEKDRVFNELLQKTSLVADLQSQVTALEAENLRLKSAQSQGAPPQSSGVQSDDQGQAGQQPSK